MIIFLLIQILVYITSLFFAVFPTVETLPWGVDEFVYSGVAYFRYLMDFFPPFSTVLNAFLIYIAFALSIMVLRFFLGNRTPTNY